jgi:hypothetical protein
MPDAGSDRTGRTTHLISAAAQDLIAADSRCPRRWPEVAGAPATSTLRSMAANTVATGDSPPVRYVDRGQVLAEKPHGQTLESGAPN